MFSLNIFSFEPGATAPYVLQDMPAVEDPSVSLNNNRHIIFQQQIQLQLAYFVGSADITQGQFQTPKLRPVALPDIRPLDGGAFPSTRPPICSYRRAPLILNPVDENSSQVSDSVGTDTVTTFAAYWFSDGNNAVAQGPNYQMAWSAAISPTAFAWSPATVILQQTLPAGTYAIVGMDAWCVNGLFVRIIFPNQQWRPGIICGGSPTFINAPCFRDGQLGTYGTFASFAQPQVDVFCDGTATQVNGLWDLVKIG